MCTDNKEQNNFNVIKKYLELINYSGTIDNDQVLMPNEIEAILRKYEDKYSTYLLKSEEDFHEINYPSLAIMNKINNKDINYCIFLKKENDKIMVISKKQIDGIWIPIPVINRFISNIVISNVD